MGLNQEAALPTTLQGPSPGALSRATGQGRRRPEKEVTAGATCPTPSSGTASDRWQFLQLLQSSPTFAPVVNSEAGTKQQTRH